MPTSTVFSAKPHKCLLTLPSGVFSPSYAMNSGARGLHSLGFPWAYAEVTKLVPKKTSMIQFFAQFARSYLSRSYCSLFSIAATMYAAWELLRSRHMTMLEGVQHLNQSTSRLTKNWLMYVNYRKVSASVLLSFASSKKIPQGFRFQEKVHVMEGPQTKLAIQFCLLFFWNVILFLCSCCTLIGTTCDCVFIEFYSVADSPPSA